MINRWQWTCWGRRPHFPLEGQWTGAGTKILSPYCPRWQVWSVCQFLEPVQQPSGSMSRQFQWQLGRRGEYQQDYYYYFRHFDFTLNPGLLASQDLSCRDAGQHGRNPGQVATLTFTDSVDIHRRSHPMEPVGRVLSDFWERGDQVCLMSSNFCDWLSFLLLMPVVYLLTTVLS